MSIQALNDVLIKQLDGSTNITREQVQEWKQLYPYFSLPLMLYSRNQLHNDKENLALSMIYAGNLDEWAVQLGVNSDYTHFYPENGNTTPTTDSAIDLFIHTYGNDDTDVAEIEELLSDNDIHNSEHTQPLITIPAYDYMSELEAMPDAEDAHPLQEEDLLENFLRAEAAGEQMFSKPDFNQPVDVKPDRPQMHSENEALFSESLAKIYIQQRRYAKALEIIRKLSLNNPEKNVYFADQIRFLEKLIINVKN